MLRMPWRRHVVRAVLLSPVCVILLLAYSAWRKNELNYQLTEAVGRHDLVRSRELLESGADPSAPWSGYSISDHVNQRLGRWSARDYGSILDWTKNDLPMHDLLSKYARGLATTTPKP